MPLHRYHPRRIRVHQLRSLDEAVLGPRHRLEPRCEIADRLMMAAVHRCRTHAKGTFEKRPGRDAHCVLARLVAVRHGTGPLAVEVLVEGAAERDVEDLTAATDRENRQAARPPRFDE